MRSYGPKRSRVRKSRTATASTGCTARGIVEVWRWTTRGSRAGGENTLNQSAVHYCTADWYREFHAVQNCTAHGTTCQGGFAHPRLFQTVRSHFNSDLRVVRFVGNVSSRGIFWELHWEVFSSRETRKLERKFR